MNELQFLNYVGWIGCRLLQNLLAKFLLVAPWGGAILLVNFDTGLPEKKLTSRPVCQLIAKN